MWTFYTAGEHTVYKIIPLIYKFWTFQYHIISISKLIQWPGERTKMSFSLEDSKADAACRS